MTEDGQARAAQPKRKANGVVSNAGSWFLNGWAVDALGDPCVISVLVNGEERHSVVSDLPRPHLKERGKSNGLGGWSVDLRPLVRPGPNRIELRLADGSSLRNAPFVHHAPASPRKPDPATPALFRSYAELVEETILRGWIVGANGEPGTIMLHVNGAAPLTMLADVPTAAQIDGANRPAFGWAIDLAPLLMRGMNIIELRDPEGFAVSERPFQVKHAPPKAQPVPDAASAPQNQGAAADGASQAAPPAQPAAKPSAERTLAEELDDLSLDDISLAFAAGMLDLKAPTPSTPAPKAPEPVTVPASEPEGYGLLARLLGRKKR